MTANDGLILAIETSCDETAVAVAGEDGRILSSLISSQVEIHSPYGGVVPELASRNHNLNLRPLIDKLLLEGGYSLDRISAVAATAGPGLASSLLVGDTTAKALALGLGIPFYSINHLEGHLLSPFIGHAEGIVPNISLIVSGGHTMLVRVISVGKYEVLGSTSDDAAGEAFDKVGKMLGLPYPGGPQIDRLSRKGRSDEFDLPRSMIESGDDQFSFSGLKTAVFYLLKNRPDPIPEPVLTDLCASFQAAVVDVLVSKLFAAAQREEANTVTISGGVSCNTALRDAVESQARKEFLQLYLAPPQFSTDNAGMIAFAAASRIRAGVPPSPLNTDIDPNLILV